MLWPRMPAGERIAAWVTWNHFVIALELAQLPDQRRRIALYVILPVVFQSFYQSIYH